MGAVSRNAKRAIWTALSPAMGSSHPHYRQALWSPARQSLEGVTLSDEFAGDKTVSAWRRRTWTNIGIVAVRNGALEHLAKELGARPAVGFTMGNTVVVGEIDGSPEEAFGHLVTPSGGQGDLAHGFRIGRDDGQYAIGVMDPVSGLLVTPQPEDVYTMGPVRIEDAIAPGTGFANINFS